MTRPGHARSISGDSFGASDDEGQDQGAGSGRRPKESAKDLDQRKVQNRIAQREFRQRKVQYIKDLEARVQLHESSRDDQLDKLRNGIKALIDENQRLRELLGSVSGFIVSGEIYREFTGRWQGHSFVLNENEGRWIGRNSTATRYRPARFVRRSPRSNVKTYFLDTPPEFQALINRNRTEHVFEVINSTGKPPEEFTGTKRPSSNSFSNANGAAGPSSFKRARTDDMESPVEMAEMGSSVAASMYNLPSMGEHPFPGRSTSYGAALYNPHTASSNAGSPALDPIQRDADALDSVRPRLSDPGTDATAPQEEIQELFSMPTDNPKLQAIQLISCEFYSLCSPLEVGRTEKTEYRSYGKQAQQPLVSSPAKSESHRNPDYGPP
ncbi:hypothetical protein P7C70_g3298, partial [Phenoliferia sp. Uapishka_3]